MSLKKIYKIMDFNKYKFLYLESTSSTMNEAKNFLEKKNNNCLILAERQTDGRGRRNNIWHSPKGNIYCSITFNNILEIQENFLFSILVVVSIKDALENFNAENIKFKWPNDVYHNDKKFSGVIAESFQTSRKNDYMILGIGINFESSPKIKDYPTTHIKSFCNFENFYNFLSIFFDNLFNNFKNINKKNYNHLIEKYKKNLMFLGEKINIKKDDTSIITGIFEEVNTDGSLILRNNKGLQRIYNGSIIL